MSHYRNGNEKSADSTGQIEEISKTSNQSEDEIEIDTDLPCKIEPIEVEANNEISKV